MVIRSLFCLAVVPSALLISPASAADINYRCGDGTPVQARFNNEPGSSSVDLTFIATGRHVVLPQALSADGGRYVGADMEFWIKGQSATLTENSRQTLCQVQ